MAQNEPLTREALIESLRSLADELEATSVDFAGTDVHVSVCDFGPGGVALMEFSRTLFAYPRINQDNQVVADVFPGVRFYGSVTHLAAKRRVNKTVDEYVLTDGAA